MAPEPLDLEQTNEGDRLKALYRQAQVGKCVNGVTHDANNMMGAIMAYADLVALDEGLSEKKQHMLQQISENVERCSELLGKLTDIARKETDTQSYCDIPLLLDAALKLRSYDHNLHRIQVETDIPPLASGILGNPPKLQIAFLELMHNAEAAMEGCEDKVLRVTMQCDEERTEIAFWNTGLTLTNETFEALVQPYRTTCAGAHIGLGLPMVKEIIEEVHDGTFGYAQERGFIITLPHRVVI